MARLYLIRHGRPSSTWGGHDDDPGLDEAGLAHKREVLGRVLRLHAGAQAPLEALAALGGLEIAAMVGAVLLAKKRL